MPHPLGFDSLKHSLHESRITLRRLLRRDSTRSQLPKQHADPPYLVSDAIAAEVVMALDERDGLSATEARALYEAAAVAEGETPLTFDQLLDRDWISIVLGRLRAPHELKAASKLADPATEAGVRALMDARHRRTRSLGAEPTAGALPLVSSLLADSEMRLPTPPSPGSVAARVWEATVASGLGDALITWFGRWRQLTSAWFILSEELGPRSRSELVSAVLARLGAEPNIRGWPEERRRVVAQWYLSSHKLPDGDLSALSAPPRTLLDRMVWLDHHQVHVTMHDLRSDLDTLIGLLLDDIADADFSPAPHATMKELVRLAEDRPWILASIRARIGWEPELLADLVLLPSTAPAATMLLASMTLRSSAWDNAVRHRDVHATRHQTFEAFLAVVSHHMNSSAEALVEEVVALHVWLHATAATPEPQTGQRSLDRSLLDSFGREVERWPDASRARFADAHVGHLATAKLGAPQLAALLDALARTDRTAKVDGAKLIEIYAQSLSEAEFEPRVDTIDPVAAYTLASIAERAGASTWQRFLEPLQFADLARATQSLPEDQRFATVRAIEVQVRSHLRILLRACAGWEDDPPATLIAAIGRLLAAGSHDAPADGCVAAFASRYETWPHALQGPLAADIAAALLAIAAEPRAELIQRLVLVDEPALLARTARALPPVDRARLLQRIELLEPEEAGRTWALTEVLARIDSLLDLRAFDAAAKFMEFERTLETWGPVAGRELTRFRNELRLAMGRGNYAAVLAMNAPSMKGEDSLRANELLAESQAIANIKATEGDPGKAVAALRRLVERDPRNVTHTLNLFAARVRALLPSPPASPTIEHSRRAEARALLRDTEIAISSLALGAGARRSYSLNRAIVLMALGDAALAYEALREIPGDLADDEDAAVLAHQALQHLGRGDEATALVERARQLHGPTEQLRDVEGSAIGAATVLTNHIADLSRAWAAIRQLEPESVAQVLLARDPVALVPFITRMVRQAGALTTDLPAHVRANVAHWKEDDITEVLRGFLNSHLDLVGWHSEMQSPGGETAKGGRAERDLVVKSRGAEDLAVIEAVMLRSDDNPATKFPTADLTEHFVRLFANGSGTLSFHVTYSFWRDVNSVLAVVKDLSKRTRGTAWTRTAFEDLDPSSVVQGFVATYSGADVREVRVVFLVMNLNHWARTQAAQTAGAMKARAPKKPS